MQEVVSKLPLHEIEAVLYSPESKEAAIIMAEHPFSHGSSGLYTKWAVALDHLVPVSWIFESGEHPDHSETWLPLARGTGLRDYTKVAAAYESMDEQLAAMIVMGSLPDLYKEAAPGPAAGTIPSTPGYSPTLRAIGERLDTCREAVSRGRFQACRGT